MSLRKLIREYIEDAVNQDFIESEIDSIVDFDLIEKKEEGGKVTLKYEFKENDYTIRLYIVKTSSDNWYYKLFVYWKAFSKSFTSGKGKDFELQFGPFENFDDLKKSLNYSINNHVLLSKKNFHDNNKTQLDDEIFMLINDLKKYKEKIEITDNKYFNDLKRILPKLIDHDYRVKHYIAKEFDDEEDKQNLILILQKMYKLDLHNQIDHTKSLFKTIY
ncbi:MAG: hypothetical protein KatS3mg035_1117 [Bacteroidia bacterium]|nr:MAG: hypothetical protein KatS3mg035_1117 [Bacteroidia bacterium]